MYSRTVYTLAFSLKANYFPWGEQPLKWLASENSWIPSTSSDMNSLMGVFTKSVAANLTNVLPWRGVFHSSWQGSYLLTQSGSPPDKLRGSRTIPRMGVKHKNFKDLVRKGEIVVSDFLSDSSIVIEASPPFIRGSQGAGFLASFNLANSGLWTIVPDPGGGPAGYCYIHNGVIYKAGAIQSQYDSTTETIDKVSDGYNMDSHLDRIQTNLLNTPIDSDIVTLALADASAGQFDVLSNLAEMPETYKAILQGCMTILRLYRDVKNRNLRLEDQLSKLQKIQDPSAAVRKRIADTLKAISDVWLTFRLGIEPTAKMVEELILLDLPNEYSFYRYRQTRDFELDCSYSGEKCTIPVKNRCFIKRSYISSVAALGFPPFGAVWELVPLSFVIDRYVNIGAVIVSQTTPNLSTREGSTYSWHVSGQNGASTFTGWSYSVTVSSYRRTVINPNRYCGFDFPPDTSLKQDADHLALAWNLLLDDLIRPKKGT